jgi:hypothetical protein
MYRSLTIVRDDRAFDWLPCCPFAPPLSFRPTGEIYTPACLLCVCIDLSLSFEMTGFLIGLQCCPFAPRCPFDQREKSIHLHSPLFLRIAFSLSSNTTQKSGQLLQKVYQSFIPFCTVQKLFGVYPIYPNYGEYKPEYRTNGNVLKKVLT